MKKDFIKPILALSFICLFISGMLALGNFKTRPIIEEAASKREGEAMAEIIPNAGEFTPIYQTLKDHKFPYSIAEIYESSAGNGFVFIVNAIGYGGEFKLMCGIDNDGGSIRNKVLEHNETPGFGDKAFAEAMSQEEKGKRFDGLTGATVSSGGYIRGVQDALDAFEIVKEARS
ncbi:MAG: FMN-binding protein [Oscillospiraceae bacterium]|nr:FMN-binding protein [Oscillospiraceae bacterium]